MTVSVASKFRGAALRTTPELVNGGSIWRPNQTESIYHHPVRKSTPILRQAAPRQTPQLSTFTQADVQNSLLFCYIFFPIKLDRHEDPLFQTAVIHREGDNPALVPRLQLAVSA